MSTVITMMTAPRNRQLPLGIRLRPEATFDGFVPGYNAEVVATLRESFDQPRSLYLWGGAGSGKSHLLQAVCHDAAQRGIGVVYLPLAQAQELAPEMLEGLELLPRICVDDIQAIAGQADWEQALFHLYNRVRERDGGLVIAGAAPVAALGLELPDLGTRLAWDLVFQLQPLDDDALQQALRLRAQALGMELNEEVAAYMLRRCVRDVSVLFALLERLDRESLSAQRRLTIPFVREFLDPASV